MKVAALALDGSEDSQVELPPIFDTPYRRDLITRAYTILESHGFQPKGTHPTAGMDVSADSLDPPTGHGRARVARKSGGEAAEVASVRGGRQAHPPKVARKIHKKLNKKENRLALCSAIAATGSKSIVESRGHKVDKVGSFPIIVSDDIESVSQAKQVRQILDVLGLADDVKRLSNRKPRTGKSALRGRPKKVGKSVLFVAKSADMITKAVGGFAGITARSADSLSVLDLAPGAEPARLTVYSKGAIEEIAQIQSPHLELEKMLK